MNKIKNIKISQLGRSMMEMLGVLAIVGVLSVGGLSLYQQAVKRHRLNKLTDQISEIILNIKTFYRTSNFEGLTTEKAIEYHLIPEDTVVQDITVEGGKRAKNIFNGDFDITVIEDPETGDSVFAVKLTNLPKDIAMALGTMDWKDATGSLFEIKLTNGEENE